MEGKLRLAASFMFTAPGTLRNSLENALSRIECHAALTQAVAAVVSMMIAAAALLYAVKSLRAMQRQADASIAMTIETFRPIIEVLGGTLSAHSQINFENKGKERR